MSLGGKYVSTVMCLVLPMCSLISCSFVLCVCVDGLGYVYVCESYVVLDQCDEPTPLQRCNQRQQNTSCLEAGKHHTDPPNQTKTSTLGRHTGRYPLYL